MDPPVHLPHGVHADKLHYGSIGYRNSKLLETTCESKNEPASNYDGAHFAHPIGLVNYILPAAPQTTPILKVIHHPHQLRTWQQPSDFVVCRF